jgi:hypothetical protein
MSGARELTVEELREELVDVYQAWIARPDLYDLDEVRRVAASLEVTTLRTENEKRNHPHHESHQ